jgi:hypothetical protein
MKENVFRSANEVDKLVCVFWSEVAMDEIRLVLHEWMERIEPGCGHDREYVPEQTLQHLYISSTRSGVVEWRRLSGATLVSDPAFMKQANC